MKKILFCALLVMSVCLICACNDTDIGVIGGADGPTVVFTSEGNYSTQAMDGTDESYINEAVRHTVISGALAADGEFVSTYTSSLEVQDIVADISKGNYSAPVQVYKLTVDGKGLAAQSGQFSKIYNMGKFKNITFATSHNAVYGASAVAAVSMLTSQEGYVMPEQFNGDFALYLVYEGGYSSFVDFSKIGNGVVQATMSFVKNGENGIEDFKKTVEGIVGDSYTLEKIK